MCENHGLLFIVAGDMKAEARVSSGIAALHLQAGNIGRCFAAPHPEAVQPKCGSATHAESVLKKTWCRA